MQHRALIIVTTAIITQLAGRQFCLSMFGTNPHAAVYASSRAKSGGNKTHSPPVAHDLDGENFFTAPGGPGGVLPRYRADKKPAEKIRTYIQAGTPELEQIRLIGSLKGKQREDVLKTYEKGRGELQPLTDEFNQMRRQLSATFVEKMLSNEEPQMEMDMKSKDFELLLKARALIQKLRSKRLSNWEEIQAKLTTEQIGELEKLKSGEVPAAYLQEGEKNLSVPPKAD